MSINNIFHIPWIDIKAAYNDHIFFTVCNGNIAVRINIADVSGEKIAFPVQLPEHFIIGIRTLPVPFHYLWAAYGNLSVLSPGHLFGTGFNVKDFHVSAGNGKSNGAYFACFFRCWITAGRRSSFCQTIGFKNNGAGFILKLAAHFRRKRCTSGKTSYKRRDIIFINQRMIGKCHKNGRNSCHKSGLMLLNHFKNFRKRRLSCSGIRHTYQAAAGFDSQQKSTGNSKNMIPGQYS